MRKNHFKLIRIVPILAVGGLLAWAQETKEIPASERKVTETEVPAPARAALKKLAGAAALTEYAEEIEHGHKFYEGSWKALDGNVDALVTEGGDAVEIEEAIPAEKVPVPARAAVEKEAGKGTPVQFEKKTLFLYEAHYKKDGKGREIIVTPDGRHFHEDGEKTGEKAKEDEDDDEKK